MKKLDHFKVNSDNLPHFNPTIYTKYTIYKPIGYLLKYIYIHNIRYLYQKGNAEG